MTALPLCGCPLKRLEIHGGPTHNTYDAANLESSLTATLEAQRSITGNHSNLLLQSHLGLKRIFSAQLADLNITPNCEREIMKVHEPSLRISIQIRRIQQTVIFDFKRKQDFDNTITMLKRIGFCVRDGIPPTLHAIDAIDAVDTTTQQDSVSSHHFGPRLSLLTPLINNGQHISQSEFSFTSMLNSDVPLTQLLPLGTKDHCFHQPLPYNASQQSRRQTDPVTTYTSYANPHVSQPKKMYQPQISSPLRYVVPTNDQSEAPNLPMSNSQPTGQSAFFDDHAHIPSLLNLQSISEPNSLSNHSPLSEASVTSYDTSLDYQFGPPSSQDSITSVESSSQATDTTDDDFHLQLGQDFRKLLPRTRSLPFLKGRDHKVVKSKPRTKQNQRYGNSQEKETIAKNSDVPKEEKTKVANSNNVDSQLVLHHTPPQSKASQTSDTPTYHSSLETAKLSTMLITDPTLLERANKATSHLLDQYSEDLGQGCNAASYAEFYLERIHAARREFWFNELNQMN